MWLRKDHTFCIKRGIPVSDPLSSADQQNLADSSVEDRPTYWHIQASLWMHQVDAQIFHEKRQRISVNKFCMPVHC